MDGSMTLVLVGVAGLVVGFILSKVISSGASERSNAPVDAKVEWWAARETLTGTQLQILQFMEARKSATITQLQEKFSFIPDRELYYRLEQIVLMKFIFRERRDGDVVYEMNAEYSVTIEGDKTVMLADD